MRLWIFLTGLNANFQYSVTTNFTLISRHWNKCTQFFFEYVSGEDFSSDRRFKKLHCNPDNHVWEFKTEEVRVFGWVPNKDFFVCCYGDSKDKIKEFDSYGRYIAQTTFVRNNLNLNEPKCLISRSYSDVISNAD